MSNNLELKKATVAQIKEKLTTAQSVVLVDYRGLNVAEVTELRKQFRAAGVEYAVLKNSLVGIAAKEVGIEGLDSILEGPTALAFGMTDAVAPAKIIAEFAKKNDKLKVKAGILDGAILDVAGVEKLSAIPSREVLIAKVMGSMMSAVSKFVYVLEAIRKQKAGEEA
ncbi:MAG: 50S ribosomal protein L10 [Eubacteriales bacterium]|nr:50S ribosomal protein L10 [bacterium]MDY2791776.1 50S ribosomal protein L10 [Eubacteriales bacterium]